MRYPVVTLALLGAAAVAGCKKEEITSYRVPKEPTPPAAAMPADAAHAGLAKSGAPATPAAPAAPASGGGMAGTPVATASGNALVWKAPAHWQDKGSSGMRKGTFAIAGEGGATAELAITAFPGDVGGEVANVNRWRGQVQLAPQSPDEVAKAIERIEANGLRIGVVDMTGSSTRLLGAFVSHAGATWFFKLTGPDALLAKEKPAFVEFLKTIKPAGP